MERTENASLLRQIPQVEKALAWPEIAALALATSLPEATRALRSTLGDIRDELLGEAASDPRLISRDAIVSRTREALRSRAASGYPRAINATGILLHTGLGRAVLPEAAIDAVSTNLRGYSVVEVDRESGERNEREAPLQELCRELTGAQAAIVVNNNAAATLLVLAAVARGKEVIISRGQMVEIGGSFRIPDILRESGARLVEVGTTNRTYASDYRQAITPDTGLLLEVHTSNYAIRGFSHHTPLEELVALGRETGIPVASDLGSGAFVDVSQFGFEREPLVSEKVSAGPDLVFFSGDKLLGGPQAGIIVGDAEMVRRVRRHPLYRCVRVDKVTLTLLEATLKLYRDPSRLRESVPPLAALAVSRDDVRRRAEAFAAALAAAGVDRDRFSVVDSEAQMGSGSLPAQVVPSAAVAIEAPSGPDALAQYLRSGDPPVFARIRDDRVILDFRSILAGDEDELARAVRSALSR